MTRLILAFWVAVAGPLYGHGDLHDSILAVTEKLMKSPQDGALYLQRASLEAAHGDHPAALADYDRAEALQADPAAVIPGRGKSLFATQRFADACTALDRLLSQEPKHVEALVTRARASAQLQNSTAAVSDFTNAIAASSRPEPEYYLERAELLAAATPPRTEEAIRGLDEGLARLGTGIVTLQLAALDLEVKTGRFDAALARISAAAAAAPRKELWLIRRGDTLALANRRTEAREAYEAALHALAGLPARVRGARATTDLESRARLSLANCAPAPAQ